MKTWGNINIGISLCDEIKRKDNNTEWIITKIDYPSEGGIFIYAISKDGETMGTKFNPNDWLKSGINYLNEFMALLNNIDKREKEHLIFFKEVADEK